MIKLGDNDDDTEISAPTRSQEPGSLVSVGGDGSSGMMSMDVTVSGISHNNLYPFRNTITVLFSDPLVHHDQDNNCFPFSPLNFIMERELLWQCLKEASRDIKLSFDTAHCDRLLKVMAKGCTCLHYSGHGDPSFLPFEDGKGKTDEITVERLKKLLIPPDGVAPLKVVFVSACHSVCAGRSSPCDLLPARLRTER
jgi:hypothetical protein